MKKYKTFQQIEVPEGMEVDQVTFRPIRPIRDNDIVTISPNWKPKDAVRTDPCEKYDYSDMIGIIDEIASGYAHVVWLDGKSVAKNDWWDPDWLVVKSNLIDLIKTIKQ